MEPRLKVLLRPQDLTGQLLPLALYFVITIIFLIWYLHCLMEPSEINLFTNLWLLCTSEPFYLRTQHFHDLSSLALAWSSSSMSMFGLVLRNIKSFFLFRKQVSQKLGPRTHREWSCVPLVSICLICCKLCCHYSLAAVRPS